MRERTCQSDGKSWTEGKEMRWEMRVAWRPEAAIKEVQKQALPQHSLSLTPPPAPLGLPRLHPD